MSRQAMDRRITRVEASVPVPSQQDPIEAILEGLPTPVLRLVLAAIRARERGQPLNAAQEAAAAQFEAAVQAAGGWP